MPRLIGLAGAASLGFALVLSGAAQAETAHRHHARHHMAVVAADAGGPATSGYRRAGRQITVHARESFLTAGTGAFPGEFNSYASWTVTPLNRAPVDLTFVGIRGTERLPNNFTVPGCCVP